MVIIILLGIFILKKKVEKNYWNFYNWSMWIVLFVFTNFYLNLSNPNRVSSCLKINYKQTNIIPLTISKPNLLLKPFYEFFINTSHNTYLPCYQNGDISSVQAITHALKMGARVIELDVFSKNNLGTNTEDIEPIVTHGIQLDSGNIFTTSYVYFSDCIKAIRKFSETTTDPIWIELELNVNKNSLAQKRIKEIILENFSTKILTPEYKIGKNKKHFSQEPIGNFINKIIITTSKNVNIINEELMDIFDSYAGDGYYLNNSANLELVASNKKVNQIQRVYPPGDIYGHFSLNYNPKYFWNNKIQLVALNFQSEDKFFQDNIQMFNSCSFVHFSEFFDNKL